MRGYQRIAGVDEAGRGPLAGPVSVAAVILPEGFQHAKLTDSKQLSEKAREEIYEELVALPEVCWTVELVSALEIDEINILKATHRAMRSVVLALQPQADAALIDGLPVSQYPIEQMALVKGDSRSVSIAAASVIAKVTRDRYMLEMAKKFPEYGFEKHKGYGTKKHLEALQKHGPCEIHRRSFAPIAQLDLGLV